MASFNWPPYWSIQFFVLLTFLLPWCWTQSSNQFEMCRSPRNSGVGPEWKFSACQPPATNMKEFMQIRVDPPGITCGNPPERFCTLVSLIHSSVLIATDTWMQPKIELKLNAYIHCVKKIIIKFLTIWTQIKLNLFCFTAASQSRFFQNKSSS